MCQVVNMTQHTGTPYSTWGTAQLRGSVTDAVTVTGVTSKFKTEFSVKKLDTWGASQNKFNFWVLASLLRGNARKKNLQLRRMQPQIKTLMMRPVIRVELRTPHIPSKPSRRQRAFNDWSLARCRPFRKIIRRQKVDATTATQQLPTDPVPPSARVVVSFEMMLRATSEYSCG